LPVDQSLHRQAKIKVEPLWVDAGHNDVFTRCERELFDALEQFLKSLSQGEGDQQKARKRAGSS